MAGVPGGNIFPDPSGLISFAERAERFGSVKIGVNFVRSVSLDIFKRIELDEGLEKTVAWYREKLTASV